MSGGLLDHYILVGKKPVKVSRDEWAAWMRDDDSGRILAREKIGSVIVSTIFLGIDRGDGLGPPVLFETKSFHGPIGTDVKRHTDYEGAMANHRAACDQLRKVTVKAALAMVRGRPKPRRSGIKK